jgi:flagella basal body P-ring formation protein FlgA
LNSNIDDKVFVFGTGVKIKHNKPIPKSSRSLIHPPLIKRGDMINLSIRKNGITIEVKGKAMSNGYERDEIKFKASSGKVLKGKIISEKEADVVL